jgi:hypothetical protein
MTNYTGPNTAGKAGKSNKGTPHRHPKNGCLHICSLHSQNAGFSKGIAFAARNKSLAYFGCGKHNTHTCHTLDSLTKLTSLYNHGCEIILVGNCTAMILNSKPKFVADRCRAFLAVDQQFTLNVIQIKHVAS